jgi:multidrug resistance efflux pump
MSKSGFGFLLENVMNKKHSLAIFRVILISALLVGCSGGAPANEQPAAVPQSQSAVNLNDDIVSASAEVVAGKWANLAFMMGAPTVDILIEEGNKVKSGDALALFPDNALPQSIINAKADFIIAQSALDNLLIADTALAQTVIALRNAEDDYNQAFDYRKTLNGLITSEEVVTKKKNTPYGQIEVQEIKKTEGYADKYTIAKADEKLALTTAKLDDVKRELTRLQNLQTSPDVLAAQTRLDAIKSIIDQSNLFAPFGGTVIELYLNSGEMVSPGAPVLLLADLSTLQVKTTDLNEVDVARVQIGDPVKVTFDALPDTSVTGKVTEIALKNAPGSGVYFNVTIALDEIPAELRWGMSAFVEIQVSK